MSGGLQDSVDGFRKARPVGSFEAELTALFEPAVIVVMGLLVGFVAVALVSAMYGVFNQVKV